MDILDVVTRKPVGKRLGPFPEASVTGMAFSSDNSVLIASRVKDKQLTTQTWDVRTGRETGAPLVVQDVDRESGPALSPDGSISAVPIASSPRLELWRVADRTRLGSIDTPTTFRYSEFSPDGRTLVVYQWDGHSAHTSQLGLWDTASLKPVGDPITWPDNDQICCLAFRPDGRTLITTSGETHKAAKVRQWDTATQKEIRPGFALVPAQVNQQSGNVLFTMAVAGLDDQHLLALSAGMLTVVGIDGKQQGAGLPGIASLAVSPDRTTVATTSGSTADTTVHLWHKP